MYVLSSISAHTDENWGKQHHSQQEQEHEHENIIQESYKSKQLLGNQV